MSEGSSVSGGEAVMGATGNLRLRAAEDDGVMGLGAPVLTEAVH